jgi:hypothetical protein
MEGRALGDERSPLIRWILVSLVVAFALALSGCGGGSSSTGSSGTEDAEPSAEFAGKGENGELATAGVESTPEEREAASRVVEASLKAREEGDFEGQCETLAPELVEGLEERGSKGLVNQSCASSLEKLAKRAPPASLKSPMIEPIAALRVNGTLAFAFFRGAGGKHYVVPMEKAGSEWKLGSLEIGETP